jgi:peptidoglycan/xylan/chitin deacetylase (PgdA/CDA1 family)
VFTKWISQASRQAVRLAQPLVPRQSGGITILTYHLIGAGTDSLVDLPVEVFRAQLGELRAFAQVCSLDDAVFRLERKMESHRPLVVITFDDGFDNFRTHAWPILDELQLPATLYVPVGFLDRTSGTPLSGADGLEPLTWAALRELAADPRITIGSHSWSHRDVRQIEIRELRSDLRRSRERLEHETGKPVEHFCYPQAKWSRTAEKEVQAAYRTAVVAGGRTNFSRHFNPMRLARVPVRRDMPAQVVPIVESSVWLEEWAASYTRGFR